MQRTPDPTTTAAGRTRERAAARRDVWVTGVDASAAALAGMVRDGLLVAVAGGLHLAVDVAGDRSARAAALLALGPGHLPAGGVVTARAALWAHGLLEACGPVDVAVRPPRRSEVKGGPVPVRWREVDVPAEHRVPLLARGAGAGDGRPDGPPTAATELPATEPAAPEGAAPELSVPELTVPELAVPELAVPLLAIAELAVPELAVPERAAADVLRWAHPAEAVELLLEARRAGLDLASVARCVERLAGRSFSRRAREALAATQRLAALTGAA